MLFCVILLFGNGSSFHSYFKDSVHSVSHRIERMNAWWNVVFLYLLVHEMFDPMRAFMLECLSLVVTGVASKAQHNPDIWWTIWINVPTWHFWLLHTIHIASYLQCVFNMNSSYMFSFSSMCLVNLWKGYFIYSLWVVALL